MEEQQKIENEQHPEIEDEIKEEEDNEQTSQIEYELQK